VPVDDPSSRDLRQLRRELLSSEYVSLGNRRTTSVHEFYRYPARFTPGFASTAIKAFSRPGDTVLDPFMGGGTTVVEGLRQARHVVGSDVSQLAMFITDAKTRAYQAHDLERVEAWAEEASSIVRLNRPAHIDPFWLDRGYLRHLNRRSTWRLRNAIGLALGSLGNLGTANAQTLARCAVLRTAQAALDIRRTPQMVSAFREALGVNAHAMVRAVRESSQQVSMDRRDLSERSLFRSALPGLAARMSKDHTTAPAVVVTSPPYPGVYVLYHRWKIEGRRESPAPFWIANCLDGHGQTHYTMAARLDPERRSYFNRLQSAFIDLSCIVDRRTWVVQLVGFSNIRDDLPRYLDAMRAAGFEEHKFSELATDPDGRPWRVVPSRRWWVASKARLQVAQKTSSEVALVHRLKS